MIACPEGTNAVTIRAQNGTNIASIILCTEVCRLRQEVSNAEYYALCPSGRDRKSGYIFWESGVQEGVVDPSVRSVMHLLCLRAKIYDERESQNTRC